MSGGFTLVDFSIPTRDVPMTHPAAEAPLCEDCRSLDLCFFNPLCPGCQDILLDSKTTISELLAVMRQWVPQVQRNMASLTKEILRRGGNVNDRDGLTDLTLLHYACKSGAAGVGNSISAVNLVNSLISKGADTNSKCRWTGMNALHYAIYFDTPEIVQVLSEHNPSLVMSTCSEFSNGTSLHMAAANLSLGAGKILLQNGADGSYTDSENKIPFEVIPENVPKGQADICLELSELLQNAAENPPPRSSLRSPSKTSSSPPSPPSHFPPPLVLHELHDSISSHASSKIVPAAVPKSPAPSNNSTISTTSTHHTNSTSSQAQSPTAISDITLASLGLRVGDRIVIDASSSKPKHGTLRFGGATEFQPGQWAGIELDSDIGKNDGSYAGIRYFNCKPKFGLFVPMHRIRKESEKKKKLVKTRVSLINTELAIEAQPELQMNSELQIGDRVIVSGSRTGTLRYAGTAKFAPGFWMGVELNQPTGKNDGTMNGVQYFKCQPNYGIFVLQSKVKRLQSHRAKRASGITTPATSGAESTDYYSGSGSISMATSAASGSSGAEASSPSPHLSPASARRRLGASSSKSPARHASPGRLNSPAHLSSPAHSKLSSGSYSRTSQTSSSSPDLILDIGMSVFVNKEMGAVRYIGTTDFADGVWLGVELRKPVGKNDGVVQEKRYFSCKPNHGLFVKPDKATHRGINCAKILPKQLSSS